MQRLENLEYLAIRLGISRAQVYNLIRDGSLTAPVLVKVGKRHRINPEEAEKWILAGAQLRTETANVQGVSHEQ
jgi:excisionase family DNA binding protein